MKLRNENKQSLDHVIYVIERNVLTVCGGFF